MAIGPEQVRKNIQDVEDAKYEEKARLHRKALSLVENIATYAEKLLDTKIATCTDRQVQIVWLDMEKAFRSGDAMRFVIDHAAEDLSRLLEKRYLPQGWGGVQVGSCYINLYL